MENSENVGLSRFAHIALAATALAPVLLVWAAASYEVRPFEAAAAIVITILLVMICTLILLLVGQELQTEPAGIKKASRLDKQALAFLLTYALPLIAKDGASENVAALIVFVIVLGIALVQLQIFHVNPLLGIFGFHFYEVETIASQRSCEARELLAY